MTNKNNFSDDSSNRGNQEELEKTEQQSASGGGSSDDDYIKDDDNAPFMAVVPFSLPAGYAFDAIIDGKAVRVVVPPGGCVEGDVIEVSRQPEQRGQPDLHEGGRSTTNNRKKRNSNDNGWNHGIFACFDVIGTGLFWMSLFCPCIVSGQLMERIKLNIWGYSGISDDSYRKTCTLVCIFSLLVLLIIPLTMLVLYFTIGPPQNDIIFYLAIAVVVYSWIVFLYWSATLRLEYQRKLKIGRTSDLEKECSFSTFNVWIISLWCQCCSLIQMGRQFPQNTNSRNHNNKKKNQYREYYYLSSNGLKKDAPDIV